MSEKRTVRPRAGERRQRGWRLAARVRRSHVLRVMLFVGGVLLVVAGGLLGFIPFLPGFPLGLLGIALLSMSSRRVRAWIRGLTRYLPARVRRHVERAHGGRRGSEGSEAAGQ